MEQSQKKKKKKVFTKQITALVFLGLLVILCFFNLILGDKRVPKPKPAVEGILDGGYMEEYGEYFTKRFFGEGLFRGIHFSVETILGKKESGGIYKGEGQYLLEKIAAPDEKSMKENIQKIQELAGTYYNIPVYFMLVPDAAAVQSEKLPAYAVGIDQTKQFDQIREGLGVGISWVEVSKTLMKHSDEALYYRTDNNWTSLGAHYGYEALAAAMELDTSKAPELTPYVVNNDFIGSLAKQSGYGKGYEDSITIYVPKNTKNSIRTVMANMDTKKKYATLYDSTKLEKEDKYSLFLGGDAGMIDIRTTADTTDRLLIFKDSFANCLIPFLTPFYREIVAVDPALYEGNIQEIMQKAKFTSILFLYSGNSFVTDKNISRVLGTAAPETAEGTDAGSSSESEDTAPDSGEDPSDGEEEDNVDPQDVDLQDGDSQDGDTGDEVE